MLPTFNETPNEGAKMQVKIRRIEDGPAQVEVSDPASGEVISSTDVNVGQEVALTIPGADASAIQVGEVTATPGGEDSPAAEAPEGDAPAPEGDAPAEDQPGDQPAY